ncbi:caspase-1-like [Megalops cyprinoides]|uniref:caspase-1-like n=1 Tax=Megalops cyprinoides TaxID=118141 RepID=UPI0018645D77|nr:caspase-1-like [Megalops cyprinoides]
MADKQLFSVRAKFVDKVSLGVIKLLLDDLLEAGVLNDGEKESVLEENPTKMDKARCLIDTVRKKGNKASEKCMSLLRDHDRNLYEELGLDQPAPSAQLSSKVAEQKEKTESPTPKVAEEKEQTVSRTLVPCREEFKREMLAKNSASIYIPKDRSERKRLALLINNIKFDREDMERRGAERDEECMEKLLKDLGYSVVKRRNLSAKDIDDTVKEFSQREEHAQSDSTFVVIMSHGKRDAICGIHHQGENNPDLFKLDNIFTHLNTKNCVGLRNKPKVIVIQACRGDDSGCTWVADSVPEIPPGLVDDSIRREHKEKDFISLMSCTPDTKSYRHVVEGTLFIQRLVETFNTYAHQDHIEELFRKIMNRFEDFPNQMPSKDRATLTKNFYLFPGL